jgi:hypothetical protein
VVTLLLVGHRGRKIESTVAAHCNPGRRYLLLLVVLPLQLDRRAVLLISLAGRGNEEGAYGGAASLGSNNILSFTLSRDGYFVASYPVKIARNRWVTLIL